MYSISGGRLMSNPDTLSRSEGVYAMKVLAPAVSDSDSAAAELNALTVISDRTSSTYSVHTCGMIDSFEDLDESEGKKYRCFITPAMGPNVSEIFNATGGAFSPTVLRRLCSRALLALNFLQEDCNLIHAGTFVCLQPAPGHFQL